MKPSFCVPFKSEQNADKGQDVAVVLVSHRESAMRVADAVLNL